MKTLKANQIEKNRLSEKEMGHLTGGAGKRCGCGCAFEGSGGSSTMNNGLANADLGISKGSKFVCIQTVIITGKK